jgi:hypothetical protein
VDAAKGPEHQETRNLMLWPSVPSVFLLVTSPVLQPSPAHNGSANDLVRQVVSHELHAQDEDHSHWMYRLETEKSGAKETKEVVETKEGDLTRLLAINGIPLSEQQQKSEDRRRDFSS